MAKSGFPSVTTPTPVIMPKQLSANEDSAPGMEVSIVSMSALKREAMRPLGVALKNASVAPNVEVSSRSCRQVEARLPPYA